MTPLDKLEAFICKHHDAARSLAKQSLRHWIIWANDHKYLFLVVGKHGNPCGVAIARPLDDIATVGSQKDNHDPGSSNIYADLLVADSKNAFKLLVAQAVNRFGVRKTLSMHRRGIPKYYDFGKFNLKILRS